MPDRPRRFFYLFFFRRLSVMGFCGPSEAGGLSVPVASNFGCLREISWAIGWGSVESRWFSPGVGLVLRHLRLLALGGGGGQWRWRRWWSVVGDFFASPGPALFLVRWALRWLDWSPSGDFYFWRGCGVVLSVVASVFFFLGLCLLGVAWLLAVRLDVCACCCSGCLMRVCLVLWPLISCLFCRLGLGKVVRLLDFAVSGRWCSLIT